MVTQLSINNTLPTNWQLWRIGICNTAVHLKNKINWLHTSMWRISHSKLTWKHTNCQSSCHWHHIAYWRVGDWVLMSKSWSIRNLTSYLIWSSGLWREGNSHLHWKTKSQRAACAISPTKLQTISNTSTQKR